MKKLLLFMVTIMLFFLYLVPIIFPFTSVTIDVGTVSCAYLFWYVMIFILTLMWGNIVARYGCWFFSKN
jgi:hypothetical protein